MCLVRGAGFDNTQRRYACEWHNPFFRVRSVLSLPVTSTYFVCYTPDLVKFKDESSSFVLIDGELAMTTYCNVSIFTDDTLIVRDPPELLTNGSFIFR